MRTLKTPGWVILAALVAANLPLVAAAADKDKADKALEERVRALEKKMDVEQKGEAAEKQSVRKRIEAIEQEVKDTEKSIAEKLGVTFHGFVAGDYLYNFNNPQTKVNTLMLFDTDSNSFTVNQANLNISRKKEDENLGFLINLDFGKTAEVVGGATRWSNSSSNTESNNSIELREAFLTYKVPIGDGVTLKAGKFVTLLGAEIIKNYNNFNPNINGSYSFGFGIPFTHTGLLASMPVGSVVTIDAGIVNGWDDVADNNSGKTFLGGIGITPVSWYALYISGTYGPEQTDNGHSKRGVFTAENTFTPTDQLSFIFEATYGNESDLVGPNSDDSALWYGFAGYAIFKATERLTAALRVEVFDDSDGTRFALSGTPSGDCVSGGPGALCPVTAWEIAPTLSYQVTEGLLWRAEYRHDEADKNIFQNNNGSYHEGQDTLATELIYAF